ncbi:hypothetical protein [Helicobacter mesocricetorum]|uniref:hypothetical protein n=1 Tax=Helicobacter mesocricetorum TaxID=87012 RepID=UPI000CF10871|nr:hypothetical protein [Helicobacter mesocricetorum]
MEIVGYALEIVEVVIILGLIWQVDKLRKSIDKIKHKNNNEEYNNETILDSSLMSLQCLKARIPYFISLYYFKPKDYFSLKISIPPYEISTLTSLKIDSLN